MPARGHRRRRAPLLPVHEFPGHLEGGVIFLDLRHHRPESRVLASPHALMGRAQDQDSPITVEDHRYPFTPVTCANRRQPLRDLYSSVTGT